MDPQTLELILQLANLAVWALQRLPQRDAEHEAALQKIINMINNGEQPSQEDFADVLRRIREQSQVRDNLIALKG